MVGKALEVGFALIIEGTIVGKGSICREGGTREGGTREGGTREVGTRGGGIGEGGVRILLVGGIVVGILPPIAGALGCIDALYGAVDGE